MRLSERHASKYELKIWTFGEGTAGNRNTQKMFGFKFK